MLKDFINYSSSLTLKVALSKFFHFKAHIKYNICLTVWGKRMKQSTLGLVDLGTT